MPDTPNRPLAGLYVHVPFCSGKCPYCDFYSVTAAGLIPDWIRAVAAEAAFYRDSFGPRTTLYFGGGTPSRLNPAQLAGLVGSLEAVFPFTPNREATIEANPEDLTPEWAVGALAAGFNRISLGLQSLDDRALRLLGRRHDADQARHAVAAARDAGCRNLSLDLIYAWPGQTEADWLETLEQTLAWEPEHLSCYQLTIEPGTRFHELARVGQLLLPDEETGADLFLATSNFLTSRGYLHYEVSNFARGPEFVARHNSAYWTHAPYLGLGPGAHSFRDGVRWWNRKSVRGYISEVTSGRPPLADREVLTPEQVRLERLYLGLRTSSGVDTALLSRTAADRLPDLLARGLARREPGRLVLTPPGLALADRLTVDLSD